VHGEIAPSSPTTGEVQVLWGRRGWDAEVQVERPAVGEVRGLAVHWTNLDRANRDRGASGGRCRGEIFFGLMHQALALDAEESGGNEGWVLGTSNPWFLEGFRNRMCGDSIRTRPSHLRKRVEGGSR